ncbi:hypothetical protein DAI22_08g158300 [Oryza sativa Japonica Group]|uniref:KIB1-4 beta-propeller domain-containing protein n=1 Tax=Oryza rufipogon TaxID=4529 RepID=A0A0E0QJ84_ORYRU|nr:hypothetical protein DAI22_08g158300 [Oryza sativa Japonica Group]
MELPPPPPPPPAAGRDWSDLLADMVDTVLCKLELPDFIRTAAVCTCWRAPALDLRRRGVYSFPRTPCLLYIPAAAAANGGSSTRSAELYCLADERPYTVTLPDPPIAERSIVGSSHGWLVTADARSELHLLNPATREQIELPPIATLEQVRPILEAAGDGGDLRGYEVSFYDGDMREYRAPGIYRPDELCDLLNIKAILSCDPSSSSSRRRGGGGGEGGEDGCGGCIVLLIYHVYQQPSFARVGDDKQWHWITTSSYYWSPYSDIAYRDGAFYAMNLLGGIHRYDIHHSRATRTVVLTDTLGYTLHHAYMAWTPSSGDVWRLTHLPEDEEELRTVGFHVYKVDFDSQDVVPIDSLGDEALFIGHNGTLCLSTKDYPALLPNHVYFTDDDEY